VAEVDDQVIDFVVICCGLAFVQPDLESFIDRKKEFGREFFVKAFLCLENGLLSVYLVH
jgi:hypothetical protein